MKSEQKPSFKDRLNQEADTHPTPSNDSHQDGSHHVTRDTGNTTAILFMTENRKLSFPYSYLQYVDMDNKSGDIDISFNNGKILIKGKNLDQLFMDLHRQKVSDVNINNDDIDDITITLYQE